MSQPQAETGLQLIPKGFDRDGMLHRDFAFLGHQSFGTMTV